MSVSINHSTRVATAGEAEFREGFSKIFARSYTLEDRDNLLESANDEALIALAFERWLAADRDNTDAPIMRELAYRFASKLER